MSIYATIFDNRNNNAYDVSNIISNVQISTYLEDNPGKATFDLVVDGTLEFYEGATVTIEYNSVKMFKGFVFTKTRTQDTDIISVICYDQLRYLKNSDTYVFENMTSADIFSKLCDDFVIPFRVVDSSEYICTPRVEQNKTLYEMITNACWDTLINTGQWFIIRDNFGTLEHVRVTSLQPGVMIGDDSLLTGYNFDTSIDKNTYNQIKLYRDNQDTGERDLFIVNDTVNSGDTLRWWGILQLYQQVDDNKNLAQIEEFALGMLDLYNNVKQSLRMDCLGVPTVHAGSLILCSINNIVDTPINEYLLITECIHSINNNDHTMSLKTEVFTNG